MSERTEKIRTLKNKQTAALSAVTKKRNELSDYMTSQDMLHLVKTNFEEFNDLCTVYQRCHTSHLSELSISEEVDVDENVDKESKRFEDKQSSILQFRTAVMSWISQAENDLFDDVSTHSRSSGHKSVEVW